MKQLSIVGIGPGSEGGMTREVYERLSTADLIVTYTTYAELLKSIFPHQTYETTGMRSEVERCQLAIQRCAESEDQSVVVACSGDASVYGMAGLVLEELERQNLTLPVEILPGVTAALSAGSRLGAPLTNDFCVVSLSDYLTPLETIEQRIRGALEGDFVLCLYNPTGKQRHLPYDRALALIQAKRPPETWCGLVRQIGREEESWKILPLSDLARQYPDMLTTVIVGNSLTRVCQGRLLTPRGYNLTAKEEVESHA